MVKEYPEGSIKSYEELCEHSVVYGASKHFREVQNERSVNSLTIAYLKDYNVPMNGYNDWFMFSNKSDAEAFIK